MNEYETEYAECFDVPEYETWYGWSWKYNVMIPTYGFIQIAIALSMIPAEELT